MSRRRIAQAMIVAALGTLAVSVATARSLQLVLETVDMRDRREGFAIRTFDGLVRSVARTRDGGRTFNDVSSLEALGLRGARAIAALDGRTIVAAGDGWVLRSTSAGRTFARVQVPEDLSYRKLTFAGATATGWLLGVRSDEDPSGGLFLTLDAGRTFRARTPPRDATFRDFAFLDPARGFAIDARGILRTRNGGASFEPVASAPAGRYTAVAVRGGLVLAAGEARLVRSTDGGGHWEAVHLPTDAVVRSVQAIDARRWLIVAEGDVAFRTEDAGSNWARLSDSPGRGSPRFVDGRLAYVGGSPALYVSQDAGDSWHPADPSYREDVDTELGALPPRLAQSEDNYRVEGEVPPSDEPQGRGRRAGRRGRGADTGTPRGRGSAAAEGPSSASEGEDSAVLQQAEDRGVPQSALRRAQRAAERMRKRGHSRGSDWIKGVRRRGGRRR